MADMDQAEPYEYDPIRADDILRLIKLYGADPDQDAIDCEVVEAPLAEAPVEQVRHPYEAVSWFWGSAPKDRCIRIHKKERIYLLPISSDLDAALRALRHQSQTRTLWVDAICINQDVIEERNHQVPKMNRIYANASNVCVWTGPSDDECADALRFIREQVLKVWDFDELCRNQSHHENWANLKRLLTRPWFSRRWVVQEIALAHKAQLYCGRDWVEWEDFSVAVSLFVEVESATHRLSEVMQKSQKYNFVPEFFGDVPALGAARLIDATSNLFRVSRDGSRSNLLSLEYLISKYSVFEATQPRDVIYSFLSIARDTVPQAFDGDRTTSDVPDALREWFAKKSSSRAYRVDYRQPVVEVFKDFVVFAISQSRKSDPSSALDIICRPWAPRFTRAGALAGLTINVPGKERPTVRPTDKPEAQQQAGDPAELMPLPSWISDLQGAPFGMVDHGVAGLRMDRQNADPLVGLPRFGERNYQAAGTRGIDGVITKIKHFKDPRERFALFVKGFVLDKVKLISEPARVGNIPAAWIKDFGWHKSKTIPDEFWRILVGDRDPHGRNPPKYYARACELAFKKIQGKNPLETQKLINEERSSIIADTLRRVKAVVWNKCFMRTEAERCGLVPEEAQVGDLICILYGCSVPVMLRRHDKPADEIIPEMEHNQKEANGLREQSAVKIQRLWRQRQRLKAIRARRQEAIDQQEGKLIKAGQAKRPKRRVSEWMRSPSFASISASSTSTAPSDKTWNKLLLLIITAASIGALFTENWLLLVFVVSSYALIPGRSIINRHFKASHWECGALYKYRSWIVGVALSVESACLYQARAQLTRPYWCAALICPVPIFSVWIPFIELLWAVNYTKKLPKQLPIEKDYFTTNGVLPETNQNSPDDQTVPATPNGKLVTSPRNSPRLEPSLSPIDRDPTSTESEPLAPAQPDPVPDHYYEVVGEVYLHGMMDGEAIAWQNTQIAEKNEAAMAVRFELR